MLRRFSLLLAVLPTVLVGACNSGFILDSNGSIQVAISTRGPDPDADGYSLSVDGSESYVLPATGGLSLPLKAGNHSVRLGGLSENCTVEGANPRTVVVGPSGAADVSFSVVCARATVGGFTVVVTTIGNTPDPDGYQLTVAGQPSRPIQGEATETFDDLAAGQRLITLKGLAAPCTVVGGNPRLASVVPGKTVTVRITVSCGGADS